MADKLYFFSNSRDVYPGRGAKEAVGNPPDYAQLHSIPDWRRVLSNFSADGVVQHDGLSYRTIEHAFQAAKIRLKSSERAFDFALESGSDLSKGTGSDARGQRRVVLLEAPYLDAWASLRDEVLMELWRYKTRHCPVFRSVLRHTRDAQLWHIQLRRSAVRWRSLEDIRAEAFG